jgi:hypothetical protein
LVAHETTTPKPVAPAPVLSSVKPPANPKASPLASKKKLTKAHHHKPSGKTEAKVHSTNAPPPPLRAATQTPPPATQTSSPAAAPNNNAAKPQKPSAGIPKGQP